MQGVLQKDKLMSGGASNTGFSFFSSGLHFIRGELKSISWRMQQKNNMKSEMHFAGCEDRHQRHDQNHIFHQMKLKTFSWFLTCPLKALVGMGLIRSGVLERSMSTFSSGFKIGAGASTSSTWERIRRREKEKKKKTCTTSSLYQLCWWCRTKTQVLMLKVTATAGRSLMYFNTSKTPCCH